MARKFAIEIEIDDNGSVKALGRDLDTLEDKSKRAERSMDKLKSSLALLSKAAVAAGAAAAAALGALAFSSLKLAADAEESENLFMVSMGNMEGAARKFSEETSAALGLFAVDVRKYLSVLNEMLKSMGLGADAAFEMSTGMTQLAFDMASFFNLSPDEAFEKIRSGITGQTEPLQQLGILLHENTIKEDAYAAGIAERGSQLTQQQKVEARYIALLRQTEAAQGDLARTGGSLTNQQRRLEAQWKNLRMELGKELIPVVTTLATEFNKMATDPAVIQFFRDLGSAVASAVEVMGGLLGSLAQLNAAAGFDSLAGLPEEVLRGMKEVAEARIAAGGTKRWRIKGEIVEVPTAELREAEEMLVRIDKLLAQMEADAWIAAMDAATDAALTAEAKAIGAAAATANWAAELAALDDSGRTLEERVVHLGDQVTALEMQQLADEIGEAFDPGVIDPFIEGVTELADEQAVLTDLTDEYGEKWEETASILKNEMLNAFAEIARGGDAAASLLELAFVGAGAAIGAYFGNAQLGAQLGGIIGSLFGGGGDGSKRRKREAAAREAEQQAAEDAAIAAEALAIQLGDLGFEMHETVQHAMEMADEFARIGADPALAFKQMSDSLNAMRNSILGVNESVEDRIRREAEEFNAQLALTEAELTLKQAELQAQLAILEAQGQVVEAKLNMDRAYISGMEGVAIATGATAETIARSLDAIASVLANLPDIISGDDIEKAIRRAKGGMGGLSKGLGKMGKSLEDALDELEDFYEELTGGFGGLGGGTPREQMDAALAELIRVGDLAIGGDKRAMAQFDDLARELIKMATDFSPGSLGVILDIITDILERIFAGQDLEGFAGGGVVTEQQVIRVGEAGPEAIIPLVGGAVPVKFDSGLLRASMDGNIHLLRIANEISGLRRDAHLGKNLEAGRRAARVGSIIMPPSDNVLRTYRPRLF